LGKERRGDGKEEGGGFYRLSRMEKEGRGKVCSLTREREGSP